MSASYFNATSIELSLCKRRGCRALHIHLLDADGVVRAQAVIAHDQIDALASELLIVKESVPGGASSTERH